LPTIADAALRRCAARALQAFEARVEPAFCSLRWQVIHHDFHPDNVLLHADDADRVAGVIDFGDMLYSPLVADIGVAASYLRSAGDDPLQQVLHFLAGYCEVEPLAEDEVALLPDLIRIRLAASICIMRWRAGVTRGSDPYLDEFGAGVETAGRFLITLDSCEEGLLEERLVKACCG
jgi:Ser/Thr protein kinase RdoA (MazF antagonist)